MIDTISALATAPTISSIAVVRVSGPQSLTIAKQIAKRKNFTPRNATLTTLYDINGDILDEAIVIYFKSPYSYTGENIVEFQCHGGVVVANMILQATIEYGARVANPGEFSKRAFLNGKIDLIKAEAIAKLIETRSEDGAKLLARQLKGKLQHFIDKIKDDLIEILAFVEVNIDYAEEDLPQDLIDQIKVKLDNSRVELEKSLNASRSREGLIEGFKVSIIGKPNVGKSSLLNSLLNFNRAIVSSVAGTTRDTIEENIKINSHLIKIVDTAGIRESSDTIEKIGIERSVNAIKESEIVIALFDNSSNFEEEDQKILDLINKYREKKEIIIAINKIDLESKLNESNLTEYSPIKISTKKDSKEIVERLEQILEKQTLTDDMVLISKRQVTAVTKAKKEIESSTTLLSEGELELFAFHLNEAITAISSITRNFDRGEILDKMFGNFCLGK